MAIPKVEKPHSSPGESGLLRALRPDDTVDDRLRASVDPRNPRQLSATSQAILLLQGIQRKEESLPPPPSGLFGHVKKVFGGGARREQKGGEYSLLLNTTRLGLANQITSSRATGEYATIDATNQQNVDQIINEEIEGLANDATSQRQIRFLTLGLVGDTLQGPQYLQKFMAEQGMLQRPDELRQIHAVAHRTIERCRRIRERTDELEPYMSLINRLRSFCILIEDFAPKGTQFEKKYGTYGA